MRKNLANQVVCAQLIAKADGTPVTSGTTTVYVLGDGGTQGSGAGTVTHEGNGCWGYVPTAGETNYNHVAFTFVNSNAVNTTVQVYPLIQPFYNAALTITQGTVDTSILAASRTVFETSLTELTADHYNGLLLKFVDGILVGQGATVVDYVYTGNNKGKLTVSELTEVPGHGDMFVLM